MFEKLRDYVSRQLEIPAEQITRDTTFETLGVDSLDIVEMITDLEDELGVELVLEEAGQITTVGEMADFIESRMG